MLVLSPEGKHLGTLSTGTRIANVGWGEDGRTLYLTADMYLCRIRTLTKGAGFNDEKTLPSPYRTEPPAMAADWPQFLGPTADGVSTETGLIDAFPKGGLKPLFAKRIGTGYAAPSIRDGKAVVFHRAANCTRWRKAIILRRWSSM